jgi:hypothetical protein
MLHARTPREFAEARMALLVAGTPSDVDAAWSARARFPRPERRWIEQIHADLHRVDPATVRFTTTRLSDTVVRFDGPEGEDAADERTARDLLVVLADKAHSLTVRPFVFLQALPRDRYDVAVLSDTPGRSYQHGLEGLGDDHEEVVATLRRLGEGRRVVVVGVCLGGAPAFLLARRIGAARALSIGGSGTRRLDAGLLGSDEADLQHGAGDAGEGRGPELAAVFGAGFGVDADRALELREAFGDVRLIAVDGVRDHRVLTRAEEAGTLCELLATLLDHPLPPARRSAVVMTDPLPAPDAPTYRRRMTDHAAKVTAAADLVVPSPLEDVGRSAPSSAPTSARRVTARRSASAGYRIRGVARRLAGRVVRGVPMPQRARRTIQVMLYRWTSLAIDVDRSRRPHSRA